MEKNIKIIIGASLLLAIYIIIDALFNQQLWTANRHLTIDLQKNDSQAIQTFFMLFSDIVFLAPVITFVLYLFSNHKLRYITFFIAIFIEVYINATLKNIYSQPRPYMVDEQIQAFTCESEYGKPSGHSQASTFMLFLVPYVLDNSFYSTMTLKKAFILLGLTIGFVIIGLSRIYLGVHTLGQVLLGWLIGIYLVVVFVNGIYDYLHNILIQIIENKHKKNVVLLTTIILLLISLGIQIMLVQLNNGVKVSTTDLNSWLIMAQSKCSSLDGLTIDSSPILMNECFNQTSVIYFLATFIIGLILKQGQYHPDQFSTHHKCLHIKHKILRVLILIGLCLFALPLLAAINLDNTYSKFFAFYFIGTLFFGAVLSSLYPLALERFHVHVKGDINIMILEEKEEQEEKMLN